MVQMIFGDKTDDQSNKRQKINPPPNNMQEDLARRIEALEQQQNQPELLQALINAIDKHVANKSFDPEGNLLQTSTYFGEEVQCFAPDEDYPLVSYLNTSPLHIIRHRHYTSLESFVRDLLSFFDFTLEKHSDNLQYVRAYELKRFAVAELNKRFGMQMPEVPPMDNNQIEEYFNPYQRYGTGGGKRGFQYKLIDKKGWAAMKAILSELYKGLDAAKDWLEKYNDYPNKVDDNDGYDDDY